eukprot:2406426-Pyramimonas_sp.AAC.1
MGACWGRRVHTVPIHAIEAPASGAENNSQLVAQLPTRGVRGRINCFRSGPVGPREPSIAMGGPVMPSAAWRKGDWASSRGQRKSG